MAYRGRGRGRGCGYRGSGGYGFAKQDPFELFPLQDIELPDAKSATVEENLVVRNSRLQNFWKASPYYLEETVSNKSQITDVERYSDRTKPKTTITRDSLSQILELQIFPQELIGGSKGQQPPRKKFRWNPESELRKLDYLEKLEEKLQGQEGIGDKEKKEGKSEDEDENEEDEETEEESDGDYNENEYFDDDEDDYNEVDDGGDDDGVY